MKYKALVLSFLLLLPLAFAIARADWPTQPPQQDYQQPILFVDVNGTGVHYVGPSSIRNWSSDLKVWGPCVVSSNFNVDVKLWNDNTTTGKKIYDVFAVDFSLTWSSAAAYIKLVSVVAHLPTGWFLANETKTADSYNLAMTSMDPANAIWKCNNISLATLTFHIEDEPCYPNSFFTLFDLTNNGMSGDGDVPFELTPEVDDGSYTITAGMPDIHLTSPDMYGPINWTKRLPGGEMLYFVNESAVGTVHTIKVMLSNITHAFGFYVRIEWDPLYKKTDVQKVRVGPDWILANYAYENIVVGSGYLEITLKRPIPPVKPLICAKLDVAFEFDLIVISPDYGNLPTPKDTYIQIKKASILALPVEYPNGVEYNYGWTGPVPEFVLEFPNLHNWPDFIYYSCDLINRWNPKPADITLDGHVNIDDLKTLANKYHVPCNWGNLASIGTAGVVDIFDLVFVAKNFGDC
jgi:hypothetical protein